MKRKILLTYLASGFIFIVGHLLWAAQPDWWTNYSLIDGSTRQDDAVVTIGQAKHAVQKAYEYLEFELATVGGAGSEVTNLYTTYCNPTKSVNDFKPLTLGQLKFLAKPFYDRLNSLEIGFDTSDMNSGSTDIYPWTVDQSDDADLALASIAQLKFVFSFDLSGWMPPFVDDDVDGMDDNWEIAYFGDLNRNGEGDYDNDKILDKFEWQAKTNPAVDEITQNALRDEFSYDDRGWLSTFKFVNSKLFSHSHDAEGNITQQN